MLSGKAYDVAVDVYACGIVMYALLAGRLPFDAGETDLERARTVDLVKSGKAKVKFDGPEWAGLSVESVQLITSMTAVKDGKRATAQAALDGAWIAKHCAVFRF